jgi:hypothetical protein
MKRYRFNISAGAFDDIADAVIYYNEKQKGLGKKFAMDVKATYTAIKRNPFFASVLYDDIRCAALKKFPFTIHYNIDIETKTIYILAVFNTWQEPFW